MKEHGQQSGFQNKATIGCRGISQWKRTEIQTRFRWGFSQNRFAIEAIYVIVFTINSFFERAFMPPLPRPL